MATVHSAPVAARRPNPESPVSTLTARQIRLSLVRNGFAIDQIEATIDAIVDEKDYAVAKEEWEYVSNRKHPLLQRVPKALGLSEEQIDAIWDQALR